MKTVVCIGATNGSKAAQEKRLALLTSDMAAAAAYTVQERALNRSEVAWITAGRLANSLHGTAM